MTDRIILRVLRVRLLENILKIPAHAHRVLATCACTWQPCHLSHHLQCYLYTYLYLSICYANKPVLALILSRILSIRSYPSDNIHPIISIRSYPTNYNLPILSIQLFPSNPFHPILSVHPVHLRGGMGELDLHSYFPNPRRTPFEREVRDLKN